MLKVPITLETITPLFTGNCHMEMTEIQSTSIMGSLRFWFEVICHFSGKFNNKRYSENKLNHEIFKKFIKNKPDATNEEIQKEFNLSPTAFYFGCTGWKSQIGIEKIDFHKDNFVNIEQGKTRIIEGKNWHLPKQYYQDQFTIIFTLPDESCKENILFPLLQFIQEYGFLGGKNNLGFGRVKILNPDLSKKEMNILGKKIAYSELIQVKNLKETEMESLSTYSSDKIEVMLLKETPEKKQTPKIPQKNDNPFCTAVEKYEKAHFDITDDKPQYTYIDSIKCLLLLKSKMRNRIKLPKKRHFYFGSIKTDGYDEKNYKVKGPNATKIIPLIREQERGFLAIPGIISMEETNDER